VADEDRFVLQQAKKKAALRVRGGRAKPIDWLAVTLRFIDPAEKSILDEEVEDHELDIVDPEGVLEGLDNGDLAELEKEIENYLTLETSKSNREYWNVSNCALHHLMWLTRPVPQSHLQRHSTQFQDAKSRSTRHQLCSCRYRSTARTKVVRTARGSRSAGQEEAGL
jgi:hypothetical protein